MYLKRGCQWHSQLHVHKGVTLKGLLISVPISSLEEAHWQHHVFPSTGVYLIFYDDFQSVTDFCQAVVHLLNCVGLFTIPWIIACQASLSFTISQNLFKLTSTESVLPYNYPIFCCPLFLLPSIFPRITAFSNKLVLSVRWPNTRASASASVLPMNIQGWFL